MKNEAAPNDLRSLWQNQKLEPVKMSLDEIRKRAQKHRRTIRRRNALEYVATAVVVIFLGSVIGRSPNLLMAIGDALLIAGGLYMAFQLRRRGAAGTAPADRALRTWLDFHRHELQRQRDLLRDSWRWYLGPFVPGLVVIVIAGLAANPGRLRHPWLFIGAYSVLAALAILGIRRIHLRGVRKLQRQIDELDATERES